MPRDRNTPEVLLSKVKIGDVDDCWPWLGHNRNGYGRFEMDGKNYSAHRAIYNIFRPGEISVEGPKNMNEYGFILHTCDNRICCNPHHMRVGTQAENMEDMMEKGRQKRYKSTESPRAKLTEEDVQDIRWLARMGVSRKTLRDEYGLSKPSITSLINHKTYGDL